MIRLAKWLVAVAVLCSAVGLFGQGVVYSNTALAPTTNTNNSPARFESFATVRVCTEPASGSTCSPIANIYSDVALTVPLLNPFSADQYGNFLFYAAPGTYHIQVSGPGLTQYDIPYQILGNGQGTVTLLNTTSPITGGPITANGTIACPTCATNGSAVSATSYNNVIEADTQAGSDACAKINAAIGLLPSSGGTVDARGFTSPQTCASTLPISTPNVKILFAPQLFTFSGNPGINVAATNVVLECQSVTLYNSASTQLKSAAAAPLIANTVSSLHGADGTVVRNCDLFGNSVGTIGVFLPTAYQYILDNDLVHGFTSAGVLAISGQGLITNTKANSNSGDDYVIGYDSHVANKTQAITAGGTCFHAVSGGTVYDGITAYQCGLHGLHVDGNNGGDWATSTTYVEPKFICPPNTGGTNPGLFCYYTQAVGLGSSSRPSFCQTIGCNTTDGAVTWINVGQMKGYGGGSSGSQIVENWNSIIAPNIASVAYSGASGTWADIMIEGTASAYAQQNTITDAEVRQSETPQPGVAAGIYFKYANLNAVKSILWWGGAWPGSAYPDGGGLVLDNTAAMNVFDLNCNQSYSNCLKMVNAGSHDIYVQGVYSVSGGVTGSPINGNYAVYSDSSAAHNHVGGLKVAGGTYQNGVLCNGCTGGSLFVDYIQYPFSVAVPDAANFSATYNDPTAGSQYWSVPSAAGYAFGIGTNSSIFSIVSSGIAIGNTGVGGSNVTIHGATSGAITLQPQAASGTYNWNWPTTAGTAGQVLTSQGGGSTAMTWTINSTTVNGQTCALGSTCTINPFLTGTTGTITGTALTATCDSGTASVTGATVGHPVLVSTTDGTDIGGAFNIRGSVTSSNTITVYVCGTGTPPSKAYNVVTQ